MKISHEFQSHSLNHDGSKAVAEMKAGFSSLMANVSAALPPGRERSIVTTHLQDACMWAVRGIAVQPNFQDDPDEGGE